MSQTTSEESSGIPNLALVASFGANLRSTLVTTGPILNITLQPAEPEPVAEPEPEPVIELPTIIPTTDFVSLITQRISNENFDTQSLSPEEREIYSRLNIEGFVTKFYMENFIKGRFLQGFNADLRSISTLRQPELRRLGTSLRLPAKKMYKSKKPLFREVAIYMCKYGLIHSKWKPVIDNEIFVRVYNSSENEVRSQLNDEDPAPDGFDVTELEGYHLGNVVRLVWKLRNPCIEQLLMRTLRDLKAYLKSVGATVIAGKKTKLEILVSCADQLAINKVIPDEDIRVLKSSVLKTLLSMDKRVVDRFLNAYGIYNRLKDNSIIALVKGGVCSIDLKYPSILRRATRRDFLLDENQQPNEHFLYEDYQLSDLTLTEIKTAMDNVFDDNSIYGDYMVQVDEILKIFTFSINYPTPTVAPPAPTGPTQPTSSSGQTASSSTSTEEISESGVAIISALRQVVNGQLGAEEFAQVLVENTGPSASSSSRRERRGMRGSNRRKTEEEKLRQTIATLHRIHGTANTSQDGFFVDLPPWTSRPFTRTTSHKSSHEMITEAVYYRHARRYRYNEFSQMINLNYAQYAPPSCYGRNRQFFEDKIFIFNSSDLSELLNMAFHYTKRNPLVFMMTDSQLHLLLYFGKHTKIHTTKNQMIRLKRFVDIGCQSKRKTLMKLYKTTNFQAIMSQYNKMEEYIYTPDEKIPDMIKSFQMVVPRDTNQKNYFLENYEHYAPVFARAKSPPVKYVPNKLESLTISNILKYTDKEIYNMCPLLETQPSRISASIELIINSRGTRFFIPRLTTLCPEQTAIGMDDVKDLPIVICYGNFGQMVALSISDMDMSFTESEVNGISIFRFRDHRGSEFTVSEIKELARVLSTHQSTEGVTTLIGKIDRGLLLMSNSVQKDLELVRDIKKIPADERIKIKNYLKCVFEAGMYMRRWLGPGNPFPITTEQTNAQTTDPKTGRKVTIDPQPRSQAKLAEIDHIYMNIKSQYRPLIKRFYDYTTRNDRVVSGDKMFFDMNEKVSAGRYCIRMSSIHYVTTGYHYSQLIFSEKLIDRAELFKMAHIS